LSGIFLSYRREDASGWAGRLYEHLIRDWGAGQVFMDIDAIQPGDDFREAIGRTMQSCEVVLVVIGPNWLQMRDEFGNPRLEDESDTHRAEVIAALEADVRVVPVLVGDAAMPKASDLPEPLRPLAYRNAAVIEDRRFASDVAELLASLHEYIESRPAEAASADAVPESGVRRRRTDVPSLRRNTAAESGATQAAPGPGSTLTLPMVLAVVGAAMVLIWGLFIQREWHNEYASVRGASVVALLALVAIGAYLREWRWILAAGIVGLTGFALWMLQLMTSHSDETSELFSRNQDGIPNVVTFAGALLVLAAGIIGIRTAPRSA
jgi:hypothetical protein